MAGMHDELSDMLKSKIDEEDLEDLELDEEDEEEEEEEEAKKDKDSKKPKNTKKAKKSDKKKHDKTKDEDEDDDEEYEEEDEEEEDDDSSKLKAQIRALTKNIELIQKNNASSKKDEDDKFKVSDIEVDLSDIVDSDDFDITNKKSFKNIVNIIANEVYKKSVETATKEGLKRASRIVSTTVNERLALSERVKQFYTDNPDLYEYRGLIGNMANVITADSPDISYDNLFKKLEIEARKTLGIRKQSKKSANSRKKVEFKKPKGQRKKVVNKNTPGSMKEQIEEMLDI